MLRINALACLLFSFVFLNYNCGTERGTLTDSNNASVDNGERFNFDYKNRTVSQPVGRDVRSPQNSKFVEVEVVKVVNPKLHPISFEVQYESAERKKTFLGTFSLFPADNPGRFIVATQGKVRNEGNLLLSLVLPDDVPVDDDLKVVSKKMTLGDGPDK